MQHKVSDEKAHRSRRGERVGLLALGSLIGITVMGLPGCGPPPKPASLIRLEAMRGQPLTREVQTGNPAGWAESDGYYRQAFQAWNDSDLDDAEDYTQLSTLSYRIALAQTKQKAAEAQLRADGSRLEIAQEQERFYTEEIARIQARVDLLTANLATAESRARERLIAMAAAGKPSGPSEEELASLRQELDAARARLTATEEVKANLYAAGRYNKAKNLLGRAEQELGAGDLAAARPTLAEAATETEAARTEATPKHEELEARRQLAETTQRLQTTAEAIEGVEVRNEPRGIVVAAADVFAPGNKAKLRDDRFLLLDRIASLVVEFAALPVIIEGHTDASGPKGKREALSRSYAETVRDYFLEKGIDAGRITTTGYGDTMPIEENRTAAGRAKNRRVEIVFKLR